MIEYPLGRVVGRFLTLVQGIPGDGVTPEFVPVPSLRVTFRAQLAPDRIRVLQVSDPTSILLQDIVCATDDDGYLVDGTGNRYQALPVTVDPELGVSEWMWEATITSYPGDVRPLRFLLHEYRTDTDVVDLTTVVAVPARPGMELAAWESAVLRTQANITLVQQAGIDAVADIEDAAGGVEQRAVDAATAAAASYTAQAASSAGAAATSAIAAATARTGAQTAQTAAETARSGAQAEAARAEAAASSIDMTSLNAKIDGKVAKTSTANQVYGTDAAGAQSSAARTSTPTANAIVQRDSNGRAEVATPTTAGQIATKGYVDARTPQVAKTPLTPASGTATALTASVVNGMVVIEGLITMTIPVGYTAVVAAGGIPAALRPARSTPGAAGLASSQVGVATAETDGSIQVAHQSGASRGWVNFFITYPYVG